MDLTLAAQPWQMWAIYFAILGTIVAYSLERWPVEIISVGVVCALLLFFHAFPLPGDASVTATDVLKGFANPALISIMALLVVGQGLFQSGAFDRPASALGTLARDRPRATLVGVLVLILAISAVLSNTPVVLMFIPIMTLIAGHAGITPSKIMMPISYMSILGGMTTLIGSSTNLLAADAVKDLVDFDITFFDFFIPGLGLAALGALYTLGIAPRLLPRRAPLVGTVAAESGKQFIGQLVLSPGHPLVNQSPVAGQFPDMPDITVRLVERAGQRILPPFEDLTLLPGDVLVIAATRAAITKLLAARPDMLAGMLHQSAHDNPPGSDGSEGAELVVTEAVIAPGSRLIGNTIELIRYIEGSNVTVLGIQRRSRMLRTGLRDIRLEPGDVLLLLGIERDIEGLRPNRDLIVFEWMTGAVPNLKAANRARLIFGGMVLFAATNILPIVIAAFMAAALMVASGVLNIRQAARAVDRRIFLLVGAAIALGTALERTGGATYISGLLVHYIAPFGPEILLSAFFLAIAFMTNVLSNAATAVLFAPIAVSTAIAVGADPRPFIHAVIFATNCSFATPIAYQTNLLVMGAGHYSFRDYLRAGVPLILFLWLTFSLLAPWYYGL